MKKMCLVLVLILCLSLSGCTASHTYSEGAAAQLPEGILVENEMYTTERKDGWLYITYHQDPPLDTHRLVNWQYGCSFSSLEECWNYFESGWFDTEVCGFYDALRVQRNFTTVPFELEKTYPVFNAKAFSEPILPEGWTVSEKNRITLYGAHLYYYEYRIDSTDPTFSSGRVRCFFQEENYMEAYEESKNKADRIYSIKGGDGGKVHVLQGSDRTVDVFGEFCGQLAMVSLGFSEKVSRSELRTFFKHFDLKPYGAPDPVLKKDSVPLFWVVVPFVAVAIVAVATVLLLRRKKAKAVSGPPAPPASDAEDPPAETP